MKIINPSEEALIKWDKIFDQVNSHIAIMKDQNQLLKEARDILLPRLMTGMIDAEKLKVAA